MQRRSLIAATAAAALAPALPRAALAQAAASNQAPGFYRIRVGNALVTLAFDGFATRANPTQGFVRNATVEQVAASLRAQGLDPAALQNPYTVTVVQLGGRTILFDTGNGPQPDPASQQGRALANLAAAGITPDAIDIVAFTHFHGDHVGGLLTADGTAAFPRAEVIVAEREWAFWTDAGEESRADAGRRPGFANARRRFGPYANRIRRIAPGTEIAAGIRAVETNGHSPGHTSWHLSDGDAQLMILGDLTSRPEINLTNPGWHVVFDQDAAMAEAARRRMFDRLAADRIRAVGYHWRFPANGFVRKEGDGYRLVPADWSSAV